MGRRGHGADAYDSGLAPSRALLLLALAAAVGAPLLWWWGAGPDPSTPPATPATTVSTPPAVPGPTAPAPVAVAASPAVQPVAAGRAVPAAPAPFSSARPVRDPNGDQTPDLSDLVNPGERPTMAEVIARLHAAGVHGGLGAFQPPGTRPPLIGLAVPDDFVLPEGYMRHHQATDDGQRIEAILMFSPDHRWFDAAGRPVALPADRVVPPELAPPGLPIRRIVLPPAADAGR